MYLFFSLSGFCYAIYLYKYDKNKLNNFLTYIKSFSKKINILDDKKDESDISENYDLTDVEIVNNTQDYFDDTGSTEFVEKVPIISRFYSFNNGNTN